MISTTLATLALFVSAPAPSAPALATPALATPALATPVPQDVDADELVLRFRDHVKARGLEDADAIGVIDEMLQAWEGFDEKQRKDVVDELGKCFKAKRKDLADDVPNDGLFKAAAVALGEMGGPLAAKELVDWVDHKTHRKNLALQRELILALGRTKESLGIEPLIDLITHKDFVVQGAAAEALGEFEAEDEKMRKKIFEKILKVIVPLHAQIQIDSGANVILREQYDAVAGPMITSLRRLSGHDERDPQEFMHWWNKNKREEWKTGA